jgi:hypothetical protein
LFTKSFSFLLSLDTGNTDAKIEMQRDDDGIPFHNNPIVSTFSFEIFLSSEK